MNGFKLFLLSIVLAAFSVNLFAQKTPSEKILQAVEKRNYQAALTELDALKKANKNLYDLNNYDYLAGRLYEKTGDFAAAMANYQTVANRNSILKQYALWHLSQIARSSGNLLLERLYLEEIRLFAPDSLLIEAVKTRIPRSYFESREYEAVIRLLNDQPNAGNVSATQKPPEPNPNEVRLQRENLVFLAQSYLQSGKANEAREAFTKLTNNLPNPAQPDDYALAGAKGLDMLDVGKENFGKKAPALTDFEHLRRALIYQFNRDFTDARIHYKAIIENHPTSGNVPDATYQIGRGYVQMGEFVEAINWFERVLEQFPEHPVSKDALSQAASAYSRVNKPKEAITRYQRFIEKYADAENLDRAYLNIIDINRDNGENTDALKWTAKTQEVFKGKLPETLALFAQAKTHMVQNDWQNALVDLDKLLNVADLGGTRVPGGTNKAEITFMKGLVLENLKRFGEALEVYLSIPDGRNEYYGWRATERLKLLANNEEVKPLISQKLSELTKNIEQRNAEAQRKAAQAVLRLNDNADIRAKMLEIIKKTYTTLPEYQKVPSFKLVEFGRKELKEKKTEKSSENIHRQLADELIFLGIYDEGTPELEKSLTASNEPRPTNNDLNYTLAVFYKRGEMAHRAVGFIEPLWKNIPTDYAVELIPRDQAELLYPAPYVDSLIRYAPERDVDPRFVLSIMRQESRYRADVKSYAAARGLMQFISTTSNRIAKTLNRDDFKQDELYNPPTAILFGSQYLADLFKLFPNQPQAVAAAYNGGEDNVRRWMLRSKSDVADKYVPEIVFSQSKDYAYKVLANYRVYQLIYDENLQPR
ncbi:MAG: transglycosylase SLT domain-containing protein [Pyrinomonadaceae bacterium]|nr:transglycosylase SLT domain-containing protein [Pyrinomonadaceae bacterium]